MAWYDDTFRERVAITVLNTAGAATIDVDVDIPSTLDALWEALVAASDTTVASIRVTDSDGVTLLTYDVDDGAGGAPSVANRDARIRIDGVAVEATANTIVQLWLYFDTGSTAAADASTAVTMASVLTGYIDLGTAPRNRSYDLRPIPGGRTTPLVSFGKGTNDSDDIWINLERFMERGAANLNGRRAYEEVKHIIVTGFDTSGGAVTTIYTLANCRHVEIRGKTWLRIQVTAGSNSTNYTIGVKITTCVPGVSGSHRVYQERFGLRVKDVLEAA